jgi:hypothetical protein
METSDVFFLFEHGKKIGGHRGAVTFTQRTLSNNADQDLKEQKLQSLI